MALDQIANRETNLQWRTRINALIARENSVKSYGAVGDGETDDTAQTVVIAHDFLYAPDYRQCQLTIDDRSTPSAAYLDYICINNITATEITIAYKFGTTDATPAENIRVNLRIG